MAGSGAAAAGAAVGLAAERTVTVTARMRDGRSGIGLRVTATVCGPPDNNRERALDVVDSGDGTYTSTCLLEADGEWRVSASVGGVAVSGSPVVLQHVAEPLVSTRLYLQLLEPPYFDKPMFSV